MRKIVSILLTAFTALVLKPFDYVLFGGSGLLYRSHEDLVNAARREQLSFPDGINGLDNEMELPTALRKEVGCLDLGLPDVRYGPKNQDPLYPPGGESSLLHS